MAWKVEMMEDGQKCLENIQKDPSDINPDRARPVQILPLSDQNDISKATLHWYAVSGGQANDRMEE
jgi:hypothetical protein